MRFVFKNIRVQKNIRVRNSKIKPTCSSSCSFQGFLFHSFNFLMFTSFITFVFPFVPPFPFCSLWKTSKWPNAQMTNYHISRLLALLACWGFNDNRDNPFLLPVPACKRASSKRANIWIIEQLACVRPLRGRFVGLAVKIRRLRSLVPSSR